MGLFEAADGGTLFLDEIGEMSPAMQVRLLRALDSGEVRRVGEERAFHVNVRIVGRHRQGPGREAADGRFRWDLFYRLSTVVIPVPPLRRRRGRHPAAASSTSVGAHVRPAGDLRFSPDAIGAAERLRLARQHP